MILREQETSTNQIWIAAAVVGLGIAVMLLWSPQLRRERMPLGGEDLTYSYVMPRAEPEDGPFDLSGRDVKRHLHGLEPLKDVSTKPKAGIQKDLAKKAVQDAAKKAAAAAKAAAVKQSSTKTARMRVQSVSASDRFRMKPGSAGLEKSANPLAPIYSGAGQLQKKNNSDKQQEEEKLSAAQWRAQLLVQPTAGNVSKLIAARNKGDIDDTAVLSIAEDLLKDSSEDRRTAGLLILEQMPSAKTFEFMVKNKSEFSSDLQTQIQKKIDSYGTAAKIVYLGPVILSTAASDKSAVSAALSLIQTAVSEYKKVKAGSVKQTATTVTLSQLQIFVGGLGRLSKGSDTTLAQTATTLAQEISALKTSSTTAKTTFSDNDKTDRVADLPDVR